MKRLTWDLIDRDGKVLCVFYAGSPSELDRTWLVLDPEGRYRVRGWALK